MRGPVRRYNVGMITFEDKQIKRLENALDVLTKRGYPEAVRRTLNLTVANSRKSSVKLAKEKMVIKVAASRNPAIRGIQFEQAEGRDPNKMQASVGHTAPWWPVQEFGGVVRGDGGRSLVLPTGAAGNQQGIAKRTRAVSKRNRLSNIRLNKSAVKAKNRKQRNAIAIAMAKKGEGPKEVFLDLGKGKGGIFRVFKRKVVMLHDMSRKSARVPPTPIIHPAAKKQAKFMAEVYQQQLERGLKQARRR